MLPDKETRSAMRVLDVIELISGFAVSGVSNKSISATLDINPANTTRIMQLLIDKGWARKDEKTGHFFPTPRMADVFGRVLADISRAKQQLADIEHNFSLKH